MPAKKLTVGVVCVLVGGLLALRFVGLDPKDQRPGLWLTGEEVNQPVADWSFTEEHGEISVQTRTRWLVPHSVTTYCTTHDGALYIMSAYYQGGTFPDNRAWNRNVVRDPRVRLKIGDRVFDQTLHHVTDADTRAAVHAQFVAKYPEWTSPGLDNVHILRVDPR